MKNIFKIKIHPLFYLFSFIAIITGLFREFLTFILIILLHELGHILGGLLCKIYPKQINIYPFGGLTIFNMKVNTSSLKELFIALSGPLFQIFTFFLFKSYFDFYFVKYNLFLIVFNLLPIYPLDGSKIINCCFNLFLSFKHSFFLMIYISFFSLSLFLLFLFFHHSSFVWLLLISLLLQKIIEYLNNYGYLFNQFLWERYNYKLHFKREKFINKASEMHKGYRHLFKINGYLQDEEEILRKRFDFKEKM